MSDHTQFLLVGLMYIAVLVVMYLGMTGVITWTP